MAILAESVAIEKQLPAASESKRRREVFVSFCISALLTCAVGVAAFTLPTKPTDISIERAKTNMPLAGPRAPI
jgi:hypothetical protein